MAQRKKRSTKSKTAPKTAEQSHRTAWHPLFARLIRLVLPEQNYHVYEEPPLNTEPLRPDIIVVKRTKWSTKKPVLLVPEIERFGKITIIHFSGPTDELQSSDALELLAYMAQYCRVEKMNPDNGLVLMVVANKITPRFQEAIYARGGSLQETEKGLWSGQLTQIPLHVVETSIRAECETEKLLCTMSVKVLIEPDIVESMTKEEAQLLQVLYGYVQKLHKQGKLKMARGAKHVEQTWEEIARGFNKLMPVSARLKGLDPKERLDGLEIEQVVESLGAENVVSAIGADRVVSALGAEQVVSALGAEQVVSALGAEQTLLALSDDVLRALSPDYVATLTPETQSAIANRLNRSPSIKKKSVAKKKTRPSLVFNTASSDCLGGKFMVISTATSNRTAWSVTTSSSSAHNCLANWSSASMIEASYRCESLLDSDLYADYVRTYSQWSFRHSFAVRTLRLWG